MDKTYNPQTIEARWYEQWETNGYFKPSNKADAPNYSIVIPPPNVTGTLHMGHGFQHTLMDVLIRYHRMKGDNTLWQVGVDHAGIATQMVVERQLAADNISRHDLGREKFIEKVWEWKEQSGNTISHQMRRLGSSVDWSRNRFTMDEKYSEAVIDTFIKLYEDKLIYRGKRLVNWDPKFLTAISDLEVENEEQQGHLWHIRYPLVDSNDILVVATTRPETLLGDTAVAVHPDDERYRHLIGKKIRLPLTDRIIPIIADDYVDPAFGSGCVKITPAHDFNDYAVGLRHQLPMINVLTPDAKLNDNAPNVYRGLDRFVARKKIVHDLQEQGLIEKIENHTLTVPRGDRSGEIIEPYLTDQWYVHAKPLADKALQAAADGSVSFVPDNWKKTYDLWLEDIEDWCISRQLWWGHRIPVWYDDKGNVYVGKNEKEIRQKNNLSSSIALHQDNDVLDTWFSSAIWPLATLDGPGELERFYPTSVLVTGFDIIFFWVARMVMMGLYFEGKVPFKTVYMTGLIRDPDGNKMSKTKGNVIDPLDLIDGISLEDLIQKRTQGLMQPQMKASIEKTTRKQFSGGISAFGTDAVRFTFCALANTGRDIRFDLKRLEGYRNFCNKLWNATRFVLMNTEDKNIVNDSAARSWADNWILSRLQVAIAKIHGYFDQYRFDLLAQTLHEFIWNEYCDWYLEFVKPLLNNANADATHHTLLAVLECVLRLLHPFMPFITEEIWQKIAPMIGVHDKTIMLQCYPAVDESLKNSKLENDVNKVQSWVLGMREYRSKSNIPPSQKLTAYYIPAHSGVEVIAMIENYWPATQLLSKIDLLPYDSQKPLSELVKLVIDMQEFYLDVGTLNKENEINRLRKEIEKMDKDIKRSEEKLSNENYCAKAPAQVVHNERESLKTLLHDKEKLEQQLKSFT